MSITFSQPARQDMANLDAQAQIQKLMSDEFIGGHEVPEVIEAFNSALSVNPDFGDAELVSYVRQHLATDGSVPFDLQLRASTNRDALQGSGASSGVTYTIKKTKTKDGSF